ncbi:DUF7507 domain-containing protein [Leifsonia sp. L25]|uniref:DUF7507 domain-containing protein n=1 Tax=Leifsonia sp. L25 TaxID=3423957 RepID=UPI003D685112
MQTAPAGALDAAPVCADSALLPGASTTCTAAYTVTQADLDNGSVADTVTAHGSPPGTLPPVVSPPSALSIPVAAPASLSLEKAADTATVSTVGQVVTYTFTVTNTGALTLNALSVADQQSAPAGALDAPPTCATTTLVPGASTTCTATYTVTQADLDHGSLADTAMASASPADGGPDVFSPFDALTIPANTTASLTVQKTADTATGLHGRRGGHVYVRGHERRNSDAELPHRG